MGKATHTAGPWTVRDGVFIDAPTMKQLAHLRGTKTDPVTRATANLMSAAPDLLAACEARIAFDAKVAAEPGVDDGPLSKGRINELAREQGTVVEMMRAAVAKSKGGAS